MTKPVRMRLRRVKGFNLQVESQKLNGLPAVAVTRPGPFGNRWVVGLLNCGCRNYRTCKHNKFRCETAAQAVERWRLHLTMERPALVARMKRDLRGKNQACHCKEDQPCHADVNLEVANS